MRIVSFDCPTCGRECASGSVVHELSDGNVIEFETGICTSDGFWSTKGA